MKPKQHPGHVGGLSFTKSSPWNVPVEKFPEATERPTVFLHGIYQLFQTEKTDVSIYECSSCHMLTEDLVCLLNHSSTSYVNGWWNVIVILGSQLARLRFYHVIAKLILVCFKIDVTRSRQTEPARLMKSAAKKIPSPWYNWSWKISHLCDFYNTARLVRSDMQDECGKPYIQELTTRVLTKE